MSKEELEKAIENGESVWVTWFNNKIETVDMTDVDINSIEKRFFERLHKTKAEAEHYLRHANITRTETLPFLTWEEFNKVEKINFYDKNHCYIEFYINRIENPYMIRIINHGDSYNSWGIKDYDYNEENFYKAYDECVKLFKGGGRW